MNTILKPLLARTGGWYVVIVAFIAQLIASTTVVLSTLFDELNADYSPDLEAYLNQFYSIAVPIASVSLPIIVFLLSRNIRTQVNLWKKKPEQFNLENRELAWSDSHNLIWKYALSASILSLTVSTHPQFL